MLINKNLFNNIFLDAGSLIGYERYGENGIMPWDDDIDLGFIGDNNMILEMISKCLINELCIFMYYYENNLVKQKFIQLDEDLKKNIHNLIFFNVSISQNKYIEILKNNNIDLLKMEYYDNDKKNIKIPWIDIFPYKKNKSFPIYYKYNHFLGASTKQRDHLYQGLLFNGFMTVHLHNIDINIPINRQEYLLELYGDIYEEIEIYGPHQNQYINKIKIKNDDNIKKYVLLYNTEIKKYNIII
jgi:hypothetical protein